MKAVAEGAPASCPPDIVVDAVWLQARLGHSNVQVVDTRASFGGAYIPGALPLRPEQLATNIDGIDYQMMPPALAEPVLSGVGVRRDATVVVYGVAPEYDPARLAWALYHFGHPDVRLRPGVRVTSDFVLAQLGAATVRLASHPTGRRALER